MAQDGNGNRRPEIVIEELTAAQLSKPSFRQAMASGYGAKPQVVRD